MSNVDLANLIVSSVILLTLFVVLLYSAYKIRRWNELIDQISLSSFLPGGDASKTQQGGSSLRKLKL